MKKILIILGWLIISMVSIAQNTTFIVGKSIGYIESIQKAINKASNGDIIHIKEGVYKENLKIINKNLKIVGESPNVWIKTKPLKSYSIKYPNIFIENSRVEFNDLSIFATNTTAIIAIDSTVILKNMEIVLGENSIGIFTDSTDSATKIHNSVVIFNVRINGAKKTKPVNSSQQITLFNNRGIITKGKTRLDVYKSHFSYLQVGISAMNKKTIISNSKFSNNIVGLVLSDGNYLIVSNTFQTIDRGIILMGKSKSEFLYNSFIENNIDIFILQRICNSCPHSKQFIGNIEGIFNYSKDEFVILPENFDLPDYFIGK
ncbi:hypothetical protein JYK00_05860 [Thermosipho ferrireducens]|uniref:Periplasmic copper-binding protein NosD beta helix domain-containing protein n=1 Tax=Thermosipho ferrireducens TaxID=2571116 RepID=A0ABX7S5Z4_9BACT|nr:hypothetical protein [Thermosipho ferrireducens]QTA37268.1 hypothetical protein JYK00_05860 [Thermosipho ferrireducens]